MLEKGNPYITEDGVRVSLESTEPVEIDFARADIAKRISIAADAPYAEGEVFGSVWSLSQDAGFHMEWRPEPDPPLTTEQAHEIAVGELDANLGCEGDQKQVDSYPGTVRLERSKDGRVVCSAVVGIFTREIVTP